MSIFGKRKIFIQVVLDSDLPENSSNDYKEAIGLLKEIQKTQIEINMSNQERFDALMARLDKATTDIAADYKQLLEEVKSGNISEESFATHEANITKLEELGASVENPVPGTEEEPSAEEEQTA
jgi:ketol-acid reductoisomerase